MTSQLICPTCGLAHSMSSLFCRSCGTRLVPEGQTPEAPATSQAAEDSQSRKCPDCGQVNDPQNVRCLRCGNDLI